MGLHTEAISGTFLHIVLKYSVQRLSLGSCEVCKLLAVAVGIVCEAGECWVAWMLLRNGQQVRVMRRPGRLCVVNAVHFLEETTILYKE